jgi:hypothetical protein
MKRGTAAVLLSFFALVLGAPAPDTSIRVQQTTVDFIHTTHHHVGAGNQDEGCLGLCNTSREEADELCCRPLGWVGASRDVNSQSYGSTDTDAVAGTCAGTWKSTKTVPRRLHVFLSLCTCGPWRLTDMLQSGDCWTCSPEGDDDNNASGRKSSGTAAIDTVRTQKTPNTVEERACLEFVCAPTKDGLSGGFCETWGGVSGHFCDGERLPVHCGF